MIFTAAVASLFLLVQSGKASIEGTVVNVTTNKPIAGAQISAVRLPGAATGGPGTLTTGVLGGVITGAGTGAIYRAGVTESGAPLAFQLPPATTDNDGHFLFTDLEPGRYSLRVSAEGYASDDSRPDSSSTSNLINLAPGQSARDISFRLVPGGTVSGRVTGSIGEPLVNLEVSLVKAMFNPDGRKTMIPVSMAQTNDRGEYRLFWVAPGSYYLSVASTNRPAPGVPFRPASGNKYPRVFYPNTSDVTSASPVAVRPASEVSGMDFRLLEQRTFRVRGRLIDSMTGNSPARASIGISPRDTVVTGTSSSSSPYNSVDGTFELRDVPSGAYLVHAQLPMTSRPESGQPLPMPASAVARVDVQGADVDGVVLNFRPPASIAGRVRVDGGSLADLGQMRIVLRPASTSGPTFGGIPRTAGVNADGSFVLEGVGQGEYQLQILPSQGNSYYVKTALLSGADIFAHAFEVSGNVQGTIDVVMERSGGRLTGAVRLAKAAPGVQVVLIPDERDRFDRFRVTRLDPSGHFIFPPLPPGSYKAFAFENIESNSWFDPSFLKRFEGLGTPVRIGGADMTLDLNVISQ